MVPSRFAPRWMSGALVLVLPVALVACGGNDKKTATATKVAVSISQAGKGAKYTVPKSIKGGLVDLTVTNQAKQPRSAQLVLVKGDHTTQEALKELTSESNKAPEWLRAEGGLGAVGPGHTGTASLNLPAGKYIVGDFAGPAEGPPAYAEATVTKGDEGSLPSTPVTVDAAEKGKDKFEWKIDGTLKPAPNQITFKSGGDADETFHLIVAARISGNHSDAEIVKALKSNGPPPKYLDQSSFTNTAVLDAGKSQTLTFPLRQPGRYVLFCPVSDRDGGKPHFEEGLITQVDVK